MFSKGRTYSRNEFQTKCKLAKGSYPERNDVTITLEGVRKQLAGPNPYKDVTCVRSGVPQASVLDPSLFLAYADDFLEPLTSLVHLFANHTAVYRLVIS